ncbi:hypothetical protein [Geopseudomonas aromaticivorans]
MKRSPVSLESLQFRLDILVEELEPVRFDDVGCNDFDEVKCRSDQLKGYLAKVSVSDLDDFARDVARLEEFAARVRSKAEARGYPSEETSRLYAQRVLRDESRSIIQGLIKSLPDTPEGKAARMATARLRDGWKVGVAGELPIQHMTGSLDRTIEVLQQLKAAILDLGSSAVIVANPDDHAERREEITSPPGGGL